MNAVSSAAPLPSAPTSASPSVSPVAAPPSTGGSASEFSKTLARVQQARQTERQQASQREARSMTHSADSQDTASGNKVTGSPKGAEPATNAPAAATSDQAEADNTSARTTRTNDGADEAAEDAPLPPWLETALGQRLPATDASALTGQGEPILLTAGENDPALGGAADAPAAAVSTHARDTLDAAQARFLRTEASEAGSDGGRGADAAGTAVAMEAVSTAAADKALQASSPAGGTPTPGAPGMAGLPGAGAAPATGGIEAPVRQINAPLHSPGFAPALGAQLNLMVRDGITEARLNLNPAEMGPISVRIRIDGQQARVDMAAEMAVTRQALEQAMPALASALRDSGLTLTGGGVFEQARDTRQANADGEPGRGGRGGPGTQGQGDPAEGDLARAPATTTPRGVVDLYA